MKTDVVLAGVGGQGILSVAAIIARAARRDGLVVKQSETHGMSQRGGGVVAHLRISDETIHSDLIPKGEADIVIALEPLEALRHAEFLSPDGTVVTASEPIVNFRAYPDAETLATGLNELPHVIQVEATRIAREAGSALAQNVVVLGAAADLLPVSVEKLEAQLHRLFEPKGDKVVTINRKAFAAGRGVALEPGQETAPCPTQ